MPGRGGCVNFFGNELRSFSAFASSSFPRLLDRRSRPGRRRPRSLPFRSSNGRQPRLCPLDQVRNQPVPSASPAFQSDHPRCLEGIGDRRSFDQPARGGPGPQYLLGSDRPGRRLRHRSPDDGFRRPWPPSLPRACLSAWGSGNTRRLSKFISRRWVAWCSSWLCSIRFVRLRPRPGLASSSWAFSAWPSSITRSASFLRYRSLISWPGGSAGRDGSGPRAQSPRPG